MVESLFLVRKYFRACRSSRRRRRHRRRRFCHCRHCRCHQWRRRYDVIFVTTMTWHDVIVRLERNRPITEIKKRGCYKHSLDSMFQNSAAVVAQWYSTSLLIRGSWVWILLSCFFLFFSLPISTWQVLWGCASHRCGLFQIKCWAVQLGSRIKKPSFWNFHCL